MKKIFFVAIILLFLPNVGNAQIFHAKDSVRKLPIWQVCVGDYMGTHFLQPEDRGEEYDWGNSTSHGFDKRLLLGLHLNIHKNWALRFASS